MIKSLKYLLTTTLLACTLGVSISAYADSGTCSDLEGNWYGSASVIEGPKSMDGEAVVTLDYTLQVSRSNEMGNYTASVTESNMTCSNPKMECKPMPPQTWHLTCNDNMISIPTAFYGKFRGVLYDNNSQIRLVSKGSTFVMEINLHR